MRILRITMWELFYLKDERINIIKVACIYMATIIGAGFASGQEMIKFFSKYYAGGFYGIIFAGICFSIIGGLVLDKVYKERIRNYDELVFPIVGWTLGWVLEVVVTVFMACVFSIMIAGMGNIIAATFGIDYTISVTIISFICMLIMLGDLKCIVSASAIITPLMIVGIIIIGLYVIVFKDTSVFNCNSVLVKASDNWFFSALTYVSYNSIMAMVVMSSLLPYLKTRKVGIAGGVYGGIMLCVVALIINAAIFIFYPDISLSEMPMLRIVEQYSRYAYMGYSLVLMMAMFTSAITSGYFFTDRVCSRIKTSKSYFIVILCAVVIPLSNFGFANLISFLYPLFGYIGMFLVFAVILQAFKIKKA